MDVEEAIGELKRRTGTQTDQDLARALGLGKSAIGSWRARGSVPARYIKFLAGEAATHFAFDFDAMSKVEHLALSLAIMRIIRDEGSVVSNAREFLAKGRHLGYMLVRYYHLALHEIEEPRVELGDAEDHDSLFNMLAFEEFFSTD